MKNLICFQCMSFPMKKMKIFNYRLWIKKIKLIFRKIILNKIGTMWKLNFNKFLHFCGVQIEQNFSQKHFVAKQNKNG